MIFKVYFQKSSHEVPVREKTKSIYIMAESEKDVREKLEDRPYNIEFITAIEGAYLEYEQQNNPEYKVLEIR